MVKLIRCVLNLVVTSNVGLLAQGVIMARSSGSLCHSLAGDFKCNGRAPASSWAGCGRNPRCSSFLTLSYLGRYNNAYRIRQSQRNFRDRPTESSRQYNTLIRPFGGHSKPARASSLFLCTTRGCTNEHKVIPTNEEDKTRAGKAKTNELQSSFLHKLASRFQGDFDNYNQVVKDRRLSMLPGDGGGHEHMHATLMPIHLGMHDTTFGYVTAMKLLPGLENAMMNTTSRSVGDPVKTLIAAYYLDGNPSKLFRLRLYAMFEQKGTDKIEQDHDNAGERLPNYNQAKSDRNGVAVNTVRMKIYSLSKAITGILRPILDNPLIWEDSILSVLQSRAVASNSSEQHFTELRGCDVVWTLQADKKRHAYLFRNSSSAPSTPDNAYHAVMLNKQAEIDSMVNPGTTIRIKDELSLWENELWINDRGYDVVSGNFMYGNRRGVPYMVQRVTNFVRDDISPQRLQRGETEAHQNTLRVAARYRREVVDRKLAWVLGESWRSQGEYDRKIKALAIPP